MLYYHEMAKQKNQDKLFVAQLRAGQAHLGKNDSTIAPIIKKYGNCTITPHNDFYAELLDSIISQQLSVKAASTIHSRVLALFGGSIPTPQQLLEIEDQAIRNCGVSYAKISYIKDLAAHVLDGKLDLAHISTLPNEEVITQLTAVKGIGEWSAHMFMIFSLGRLDVLPVGDLGVQKAAMNLYKLRELPKPAELHMLSKKHRWAPYESVAAWYLWRSLENT